jgi:NgoFVII C-terminal B3-like DNA-binding domain
MFFLDQPEKQRENYKTFLKLIGCLSKLFSDSEVPYLYYRVAENIFCKAFEAENLSRSDISADAKKNGIGIGLKTFLAGNNNTFQKVAEFNKARPLYNDLPPQKLIRKVSELRNSRIELTNNTHNFDNSIYHCVLREESRFKIFEEPMDFIDLDHIKIQKKQKSSISFYDGINEYSFLLSKSTLTKRFVTKNTLFEFDVDILKDPLSELFNLFSTKNVFIEKERKITQTIFLPLYGSNIKVYEGSGLNQWNASGRKRDFDEVYIPVPAIVHKISPDFFPGRDTPFDLFLPSGEILKSKICQSGEKALMSHPNKELGKWILRKILKLEEGELLTYEKLQEIGIDSVRIDKIDNLKYEINFSKIGSYENFIDINKI